MARGKKRRGVPDKREYRELDLDQIKIAMPRTETKRGVEYNVQGTRGESQDPGKFWVCPNCHKEIEPGTAHTVAWDINIGVQTRRHFHSHCWRMFQGRLT